MLTFKEYMQLRSEGWKGAAVGGGLTAALTGGNPWLTAAGAGFGSWAGDKLQNWWDKPDNKLRKWWGGSTTTDDKPIISLRNRPSAQGEDIPTVSLAQGRHQKMNIGGRDIEINQQFPVINPETGNLASAKVVGIGDKLISFEDESTKKRFTISLKRVNANIEAAERLRRRAAA